MNVTDLLQEIPESVRHPLGNIEQLMVELRVVPMVQALTELERRNETRRNTWQGQVPDLPVVEGDASRVISHVLTCIARDFRLGNGQTLHWDRSPETWNRKLRFQVNFANHTFGRHDIIRIGENSYLAMACDVFEPPKPIAASKAITSSGRPRRKAIVAGSMALAVLAFAVVANNLPTKSNIAPAARNPEHGGIPTATEPTGDQIRCADGLPRAGLVLESDTGSTRGLTLSYIPFRDSEVDTTMYGVAQAGVGIWDQRCEVIYAAAAVRNAMIDKWRSYVPFVVVVDKAGKSWQLLRAGVGVTAPHAALCMGYCGRSRALELVSDSTSITVILESVKRIEIAEYDIVDVVYRNGATVRGRLPIMQPGDRYFTVYGFTPLPTGELIDKEFALIDLRSVAVSPRVH